MPASGIHHVSAVCGAPQVNVDFYVETLGLRLVKRTVNYDDPFGYHLYYGDEVGRPGSLLTFFPIPGAVRGGSGSGMVGSTAFAAPPGSVDYWSERLRHLAHEGLTPVDRFGQRVLPLHDPDGLRIEIIEDAAVGELPGWAGAHVEAEHRLRNLHSVTLQVPAIEATAAVLQGLGFDEQGEDGGRRRLAVSGAQGAGVVDLVAADSRGRPGAGTVHHVAFTVADEDEQATLTDAMRADGLQVTDVRDRQYFKSVYFREPGGVLFELATAGPGFTIDEEDRHLGGRLQLPPWLENRRPEIERRLPEFAIPV